MGKPRISIIVPNYNREDVVEKLIESLLNQTYTDYELIIIDNNSNDRSLEIIKKKLEENTHKLKYEYRIVKLKKNYGYCLASNIGVLYSNAADYLVVINNDLILDKNWLKELVEYMDENLHIGIASSKVLYYGLNRIDSTGLIVDVYGAVMSRGFLQKPEIADKDIGRQPFSAVHGASVIVRKELFKKIGGYDNLLFMYYDDIDLSWRILLLGYEVGYVPKSICYHVKSPEYGEKLSLHKYYLSNRNRIRVMIKNLPLKHLVKFIPLTIILILLRGLYHSLKSRNALYITYGIKSILWNIAKLKSTLALRTLIKHAPNNAENILNKLITQSIELGYMKIRLKTSKSNLKTILWN